MEKGARITPPYPTPSHLTDRIIHNTYDGHCYTISGTLAGTRNSSIDQLRIDLRSDQSV